MTVTKIIKHQDYELQCSAKALDSGKFAPVLVDARQAWPSRPRTLAARGDDFPTEESAIESAHTQGVEWGQNYG